MKTSLSFNWHTKYIGVLLTLGFDSTYPWFAKKYKMQKKINTVISASITILKVDIDLFITHFH